jgi:hypothetical protein
MHKVYEVYESMQYGVPTEDTYSLFLKKIYILKGMLTWTTLVEAKLVNWRIEDTEASKKAISAKASSPVNS